MNKKMISGILTATLIAGVIAPAAVASETEGGATSDLKGEFSLFHFMEEDGGGTSKAFWNAANKFMEENPNVKIDFEFTDSDNYQEKLTTKMAGNELGDVWLTKGDMLPTFADGGLIQPADKLIDQDQGWRDSYIDGAFTDCTFDGTEWGVPFQMQANCIGIYNKDIFDEVGIEDRKSVV